MIRNVTTLRFFCTGSYEALLLLLLLLLPLLLMMTMLRERRENVSPGDTDLVSGHLPVERQPPNHKDL